MQSVLGRGCPPRPAPAAHDEGMVVGLWQCHLLTFCARAKEVASVMAGLVLGMAHTIVTPPAKAAAVPVAKSSLWVPPGSRRCTWTSISPGERGSISSSGPGQGPVRRDAADAGDASSRQERPHPQGCSGYSPGPVLPPEPPAPPTRQADEFLGRHAVHVHLERGGGPDLAQCLWEQQLPG